MDLVYSTTLLISLLGGAGALAFALLGRQAARASSRGGRKAQGRRWRTGLGWSTLVAGVGLAVSAGVHVWWGHRPGSAEALGLRPFIGEHVAFVAAAALPILAWIVWSTWRVRSAGRRDSP